VELVLIIFTHLDAFDVWRLRSVSKRWLSLLTSAPVVRAALSRWDTHHESDSARSRQETASDSLESKVRHVQAFRLGRPFSSVIVGATGGYSRLTNMTGAPKKIESLRLQGHHIAWTEDRHGDRAIILHNLRSGVSSTMRTESRELPRHIVLTMELLAFTSRDVLYTRSLPKSDEGRLQQHRLPSATEGPLGGDGHFIVQLSEARRWFIVFNGKTGILTSHSKEHNPLQWTDEHRRITRFRPLHQLIVDGTRQIVDSFTLGSFREDGRDIADPLTLRSTTVCLHERFDFQGKLLRSSEVCCPTKGRINTGVLNHVASIGVDGLYKIQFYPPGQHFPAWYHLLFDAKRGTLIPFEETSPPLNRFDHVLWKDTIFKPYVEYSDQRAPVRK